MCEHLTGTRVQTRVDRIVGALTFLDIVGSTERVLARGAQEWRADVESFRQSVDAALEREGGRLVNTRGDDIFVLCPTATMAIELRTSCA